MHSYLIIGSDEQSRTKEIQARLDALDIFVFDVITINASQSSIGINDVREFISRLQLLPSQSPMVAGIIPDASLLTMEAQQALLKTLEEPPSTAILFLGISQKNMLLPTVLSRLESVVLKEQNTTLTSTRSINKDSIISLLSASSGQRLSILSLPCKTKEESKLFLSDAIDILREQLLTPTSSNTNQISTILTRLMKLYDINQSSMNMQLLIESAFL